MSEDALSRFMVEARTRRFAWGRSDCALLVCDWLVRAADIDPAADVRGRYDTAFGARRALMEMGGYGGFARRAGMAATDAPDRGDVGLIAGRPDVLAICLGGGAWAFQGGGGVALVMRALVRRAWSCPRP